VIDVELHLSKNITVIGNGIHSKRIQKALKNNNFEFLIYKPDTKNSKGINNIDILDFSDIIFICSPNETHYKYIKQYSKNKYIFCEKPPVSSINELNLLKKINNNKIYFNFNNRFSLLGKVLNNLDKYNMGDLVYGTIINSKGLAFKKEYKNNWRSNKLSCPKGIYELVTIHDIDLLNYFFKIKKINKPSLYNFSKVGSSYDSAMVNLEIDRNINVNVFSTYYSSLYIEWLLVFTNGILHKINNNIVLRGPTATYDKEGFFKVPSILFSKNISGENDNKNSLEESILYFLDIAIKNKKFSNHHFQSAIESNKLMLQ